jgi:predicted NBD/HSP70 family sugar kinase
VADLLSDRIDVSVPVQIANEADLAALAEHRRGAGVGFNDLIYISGEAGVGAGIIHDGRPMLGSAGYAGEAGHALINPAGRQCRCGSIGCWETEAGEEALARHAGVSATGPRIVEEVLERAESGEPESLAAIREVGRWLGLGIGNLINIFNPEAVILGGFYHSLFPYIAPPVEAAARDAALKAPGGMARILASGLGPDAPLYGAAELAFSDLIADPAGASTRPPKSARV